MLLKLELKKSLLSSWLLFFFAITVILAAGVSQFFQAPVNLNTDVGRFQNLLQPGQILSLREVVLKNSLGTFHFERADNNIDTPWVMLEPRSFPANSSLLNNIINELDKIKIKAVHQLDEINISNYSLDAPSLEITLINNYRERSHIKFGIVNPIDNSTFVTVSDQKAIYHINNIKNSFSGLDLTSFVDTKIFPISFKSIASIDIHQINSGRKHILHVKKNKDSWVGQGNRGLEAEKVQGYFNLLSTLRSNLILDKADEEQTEEINKYFEKPLYKIEITDTAGKKNEYEVSGLVKSIPNLKLERWKNVLFRSTSNKFIYILEKDVLKYFNRSERKMHSLPIKKLFY